MSKGKNKRPFNGPPNARKANFTQVEVPSLLDAMVDGNEYGSIVSFAPKNGEIVPDIKRAISDLEEVRQRRCICYMANILKPGPSSIDHTDQVPFCEMVNQIPSNEKNVDIFLVTGGGSGQQVYQFSNALRPRFDSVEFILPYMCMSAGTLWALSGDRIWMDERASIGPIDPQVKTKEGSFLPAQSILTLLEYVEQQGNIALSNKQNIPWHLVRLIDNVDGRQVGDAITASNYSIQMASNFLTKYKFKSWNKHSNGNDVTEEERLKTAQDIAKLLCSNSYWKSHGHGITRQDAENELKLKIDRLESVNNLERATRRLWALMYYFFDGSNLTKTFISREYALFRQNPDKIIS